MAALEKIRLELARRNGRITDNFIDFDRLRSGTISEEQFRRCLKMGSVLDKLTDIDVNELIAMYSVENNGKFVNYQNFLRDVETVEPPQEKLSPDRGTVRLLDNEKETILARMYNFFRTRITSTGLDIVALFKDFDKHHIGRVSAAQFERCFPFTIESKIMEAIREKYSDERGDIAYNCWCADVLQEPLGGMWSGTFTGLSLVRDQGQGGFRPHDAESLLQEIRSQILSNSIRCEDFMHDYDPLRSGMISEAYFKSALGRMRLVRFQLSVADLNTLCNRYATTDKSGARKVNYMNFLKEAMPSPAELKFNGTHSIPMSSIYGTKMPDDEETRVQIVLKKVRDTIAAERMNLRPTFQDFDRAIKGTYRSQTCTRSRFERTLAINKINLLPSEVFLLLKRYTVIGADGETGYINYHSFCDEVDPRQADIDMSKVVNNTRLPATASTNIVTGTSSGNSPLRRSPAAAALETGSTFYNTTSVVPGLTVTTNINDLDMSLDGILTRLMNNVLARRARLSEFIRDGDPLRAGTIPKNKFLSAIISSKIPLKEEEMKVLVEHYANPKVPGYVNINKFLDDVDTGMELMKNPSEKPIDWEHEVKTEVGNLHATKKEEAVYNVRTQLETILRRIAADVKARGVLLPPFFKDYDRFKVDKITKVQFHQTVSRHKLPVTELEIELLKSYYEDPADSMSVRYRDFIGDVDETENVGKNLTLRQSVRKLHGIGVYGGAQGGNVTVNTSPLKVKAFTNSCGAIDVNTGEPIKEDLAISAVQKIADYVLRRNVRLEEFFKDADMLKHSFVTPHRFRHALDILGIALNEEEMVALEQAFASGKEPGAVAYQEFLGAVKATKAIPQLASITSEKTQVRTEVEEKLLDRIIEKVRIGFGSRRIVSREVFQDYDKLHKGRVTEGLFFTALLSVGLSLKPAECDSLRKAYSAGDGSMYYGEFTGRVDSSLELT